MTTFANRELRCALCGKKSGCNVIGSWNDFGDQDTEMRNYAVGVDPLDLFVVVCPHCGYVAYNLENEIQTGRVEEIKRLVAAFYANKHGNKETLPVYEKYELLAAIKQILQESDETIAETFLRAAWKADDLFQDGSANHYRKQAATYITKLLESCLDQSEKASIQLRLSEVYRRSGEFESALELLEIIEANNAVPMLSMVVSPLKRFSETKDSKQLFFRDVISNG